MCCTSLCDLPPAPCGRTGWPWTEESPQLPDVMPDGSPWPRISIVTPSYNQGQFIEETIRSVLLQGYPNLEYIVIDGGSTDGSVGVIRKYGPWLAYWVSEPDEGQSDAINKGWQRTTGKITAWLNSDDVYRPGALRRVAQGFRDRPEAVVLMGACALTDADLQVKSCKEGRRLDAQHLLLGGSVPGQPSVFLRTSLVRELGGLDEGLHFVLDWEYWLRVALCHGDAQIVLRSPVLSDARGWEGNKSSVGVARVSGSSRQRNAGERRRVLEKVFADPALPARLQRLRSESISRTYWLQARYELVAGQPAAARSSLRRARELAPGAYELLRYVARLAQTYLEEARRSPVRTVRAAMQRIGLTPLLRLWETLRLRAVAIERLRCQEKPFSELQGFSGQPIECFPPCGFYQQALTEPEAAYQGLRDWLRENLLDMEAWKIPRSEGGWAEGSLVREIRQCHRERGLVLTEIDQADPALIEEGIGRRARQYMDLFESIREKGYRRTTYPPIYCQARDGLYYLYDGHHRAAALWVLGHRSVHVVLMR